MIGVVNKVPFYLIINLTIRIKKLAKSKTRRTIRHKWRVLRRMKRWVKMESLDLFSMDLPCPWTLSSPLPRVHQQGTKVLMISQGLLTLLPQSRVLKWRWRRQWLNNLVLSHLRKEKMSKKQRRKQKCQRCQRNHHSYQQVVVWLSQDVINSA